MCWAWRPTRSDCEKVILLIWFANMGLFTGYTEQPCFIFCQITFWGADLAGRMTTWWRPDLERIRAEIAAEAELEAEVKV